MGSGRDRLSAQLDSRAGTHGKEAEEPQAEEGLRCMVLHLKDGAFEVFAARCDAQEVRKSPVRYVHGRGSDRGDVRADCNELGQGYGLSSDSWKAEGILPDD